MAALQVVVGVRLAGASEPRRRNLDACLRSLADQSAARSSYRVTVCEDGPEPAAAALAAAWADDYIFRFSRRPFSRARALNEGARATGASGADWLALLDADILVSSRWVAQLARHAGGPHPCIMPFDRVDYLTDVASQAAIADRDSTAGLETVRTSSSAHGGALWIDADLFWAVDGFDEGYTGWGCEDDDLMYKLARRCWPRRIADQALVHLWHEKAPRDEAVAANLLRFRARWNARAATRLAARTGLLRDRQTPTHHGG